MTVSVKLVNSLETANFGVRLHMYCSCNTVYFNLDTAKQAVHGVFCGSQYRK